MMTDVLTFLKSKVVVILQSLIKAYSLLPISPFSNQINHGDYPSKSKM